MVQRSPPLPTISPFAPWEESGAPNLFQMLTQLQLHDSGSTGGLQQPEGVEWDAKLKRLEAPGSHPDTEQTSQCSLEPPPHLFCQSNRAESVASSSNPASGDPTFRPTEQTKISKASRRASRRKRDQESLRRQQQAMRFAVVMQEENRYKTELCKEWQQTGICSVGDACDFAHGPQEMRGVTDNQMAIQSLAKLGNKFTRIASAKGKSVEEPPLCSPVLHPESQPVAPTAEILPVAGPLRVSTAPRSPSSVPFPTSPPPAPLLSHIASPSRQPICIGWPPLERPAPIWPPPPQSHSIPPQALYINPTSLSMCFGSASPSSASLHHNVQPTQTNAVPEPWVRKL